MTNFYFQQYASRGAEGASWRKDTPGITAAMLRELECGWTRIFPHDAFQLPPGKAGGLFRSKNGDWGALFVFCPAPPDYYGRKGGIVSNVLFFRTGGIPAGISLKNAWDHPALSAGPQDAVPSPIGIELNNFSGRTQEEQRFFSWDRHLQDQDSVVVYGLPQKPSHVSTGAFPPKAADTTKRVEKRDWPSDPFDGRKGSSGFCGKLGWLLACAEAVAIIVLGYLPKANERPVPLVSPVKVLYEISLEKLSGSQTGKIELQWKKISRGNEEYLQILGPQEINSTKGESGEDYER